MVAQVPFSDGVAVALSMPPRYIAEATLHALWDLAASVARRQPHCVPVVGEPATFAAMNTAESFPGYMAIVPDESDWMNACPARILLSLLAYRPTTYASRARCPALVILGERDSLIPAASIAKMARRLPQGELHRLDCGHFDVYAGACFDRAVELEADFLVRHLL
ncbi:MAG: alpha/beta fold hydrolase [Candidatus Geothermincolia bacterium]